MLYRIALPLALCSLFACASPQKTKMTGGKKGAEAGEKKAAAVASSCSNERKSGEPRTADVNGDNRPDMFKYYGEMDDPDRPGQKKNGLSRQDLDLNWDGHIDVCRYFDGAGKVEREELDLDYDTKIDETSYYKDGVITMSERDRNNDGKPDIVRRYQEGKLTQKETDTNDDGEIDRWEYFTAGKLDRVGLDMDFDGKVDRWAKAVEKTEG